MTPAWLHPLWKVGGGVVVAVAVLLLIGAMLRLLVPKLAAIAWTTAKEAMSQPLFYVLLADRRLRPDSLPLHPLQHAWAKTSRWSRTRA